MDQGASPIEVSVEISESCLRRRVDLEDLSEFDCLWKARSSVLKIKSSDTELGGAGV
jgi:hypothetical protein